MYCVEREYLAEELHKCVFCNKWIENKYVLLGDRNIRQYFHHRCYKCYETRLSLDDRLPNPLTCFLCDKPINDNDGTYHEYKNEIKLFHTICCHLLFRKTDT